jgi:hypothetical protein
MVRVHYYPPPLLDMKAPLTEGRRAFSLAPAFTASSRHHSVSYPMAGTSYPSTQYQSFSFPNAALRHTYRGYSVGEFKGVNVN